MRKHRQINADDIVGKTYTLITVTKYLGYVAPEHQYEYQCECGSIRKAKRSNLLHGRTKSCGCITKQLRNSKSPHWKGFGQISHSFWTHIKHHADSRNLTFTITIEEAWQMFEKQDRRCALSGRLLTMQKDINQKVARTASLDRIDSSRGYTTGNIQWIHKDINKMKLDFPLEMFLSLCKEVANYETQY